MKVAVGEEFDVMKRYWQSEEGQAQLVSSVEEGVKRARNGNYAFILESLTAKYVVNQRPCDLVTVGEQFGSRSYGFAVPKSMPRQQLDAINTAILEMHEEGDIEVSGAQAQNYCTSRVSLHTGDALAGKLCQRLCVLEGPRVPAANRKSGRTAPSGDR